MTKENVTQNQITEGVIWRQLLIFFFPIVIGTLFQQLYNTVDAVIVGRFQPYYWILYRAFCRSHSDYLTALRCEEHKKPS